MIEIIEFILESLRPENTNEVYREPFIEIIDRLDILHADLHYMLDYSREFLGENESYFVRGELKGLHNTLSTSAYLISIDIHGIDCFVNDLLLLCEV